MQIFDLRFNPKQKEDRSFAGFTYEPESVYEKKLGCLYMAGELKNALPANLKFLDQLSETIKKNYYKISFKSPEKALKECLKKTNAWLGEELKKDNVQWLGNLNFSVLCVKDFELNFTKTGSIKIILIRDGQINDIGKGLDDQEIDPYPLRVFFSVVSGKIAENDIILALTEEAFRFFESQNILTKIAACSEITPKKIKEVFPPELFSKEEGAKMSGICFLMVAKKEPGSGKICLNNIIFEKTEKLFSLPEVKRLAVFYQKIIKTLSRWKSNILSFSRDAHKLPDKIFKKAKTAAKSFRNPSKIFKNLFPKKKSTKLSFKSLAQSLIKIRQDPDAKKGLILISILFILIVAGSFVFRAASQIKQKSDNQEAINTKQAAEQKLLEENKLEKIDSPQVLLDLKKGNLNFVPEKFLLFNDSFYFYNPSSPNLYEFNLQNKTWASFIAPDEITSVSGSSGSLLFFSGPDTIFSFEKKSWGEDKIQPLKLSVNPPLFFSYGSNLYFFNDKCEIIKYPYLGKFTWGPPIKWLKDEGTLENSCQGSELMAADNSIWILQKNSILRYHSGYLQETIELNIYPKINNITKMETKTALPYFYLLDPASNRLIILEKTGAIFKQFHSDKFNDLKDFVVSGDGKTIWLLSGFDIYKIELQKKREITS